MKYTFLPHAGVTRMVILTPNYAIKLPTLVYGWKMFLYGLLANINEKTWTGQKGLCPVLWALPGGFLGIMPRCQWLTDDEFDAEVPRKWGKGKACMPVVETKSCSFGRLNGKIVAVDYGGFGWEAEPCKFCGQAVST